MTHFEFCYNHDRNKWGENGNRLVNVWIGKDKELHHVSDLKVHVPVKSKTLGKGFMLEGDAEHIEIEGDKMVIS